MVDRRNLNTNWNHKSFLYVKVMDTRIGIQVAEYFLNKAATYGECLSFIKLSKLIYIAHGYSLALGGGNLLDEDIEAQNFGPFMRYIYNNYYPKLQRYTHSVQFNKKRYKCTAPDNIIPLLDRVWDTHNKLTCTQLSYLSHKDGSPWHTAIKNGMKFIPNDIIKKYYESQLVNDIEYYI